MAGLIGENGDKPAQIGVPYDENKPFWFFVAINGNPAATLQQSPCWSRSAGRSGHRKNNRCLVIGSQQNMNVPPASLRNSDFICSSLVDMFLWPENRVCDEQNSIV